MLTDSIEITIEDNDLFYVVHLKGKLDTTVMKKFSEECQTLKYYKHIIFDLIELEYISSSGIGEFFRIMKGVEEEGKKFILCSLQSSVAKVIKLTRLEQFFKITEDLDDALRLITTDE